MSYSPNKMIWLQNIAMATMTQYVCMVVSEHNIISYGCKFICLCKYVYFVSWLECVTRLNDDAIVLCVS